MSEPKKKEKMVTETDDWGRKKFRIQEHEEQQAPKPALEVSRYKSMLIGRQESIGIEKYTGRIENNKKSKKKEVFYCEVCKEGFTVDLAYITHLNSPQHNSKIGMSMKVRDVSKDEVKNYLQQLKQTKYPGQPPPPPKEEDNQQESQEEQNEDQNLKEQHELKQQQRQAEEAEEAEEDQSQEEEDLEAMLKQCGLPTSFGSKKVKKY